MGTRYVSTKRFLAFIDSMIMMSLVVTYGYNFLLLQLADLIVVVSWGVWYCTGDFSVQTGEGLPVLALLSTYTRRTA